MNNLFVITPVYKNSVEVVYDLYIKSEKGAILEWSVTEFWENGIGVRCESNPVLITESGGVVCDIDHTWNPNLVNKTKTLFDFPECDKFDEETINRIEELWEMKGERDIEEFIQDHKLDWHLERDYVYIDGPYQIDLVTEDGFILKENIPLSITRHDYA